MAKSIANRDFPVPVAPITNTTLSFRRKNGSKFSVLFVPWKFTSGGSTAICLQLVDNEIFILLTDDRYIDPLKVCYKKN